MKKEHVDPAVLFETFSRFLDMYESNNDQQRLEMFAAIMPLMRTVRDLIQREVEMKDEISKDEVLRSAVNAAVTTTNPEVRTLAVEIMNQRTRQLKLRSRSLVR